MQISKKTVAGVAAIAALAFVAGRTTTWTPSVARAANAQDMGQDAGAMAMPTPKTPMHNHLTSMVGKWEGSIRLRMTEDMPWMEMPATADRELAMDGLFLIEHITSDMGGGMVFKGMSIMGYNAMEKKYEAVWIENMANHMSFSKGKWNADKEQFEMSGESFNPVTQKMQKTLFTLSHEGNVETVAGWGYNADGSKYKSFEGTFTKK